MDFDFRNFLVSKDFSKKSYPNNITSFEYEREVEKEPQYFCITIHENELMTAASSHREGLYCIDGILPPDEETAQKFLDEFLA